MSNYSTLFNVIQRYFLLNDISRQHWNQYGVRHSFTDSGKYQVMSEIGNSNEIV